MVITMDSREKMTSSEEAVIHYINKNKDKISELSITDIAENSFTSPATVSRTIRKCGFRNISELRYQLSSDSSLKNESFLINDILKKSYEECTKTISELDITSVLEITTLIHSARKIFIISKGLTSLMAQEFETELQLLHYNTCFLDDSELIKKLKFLIQPNDLLVIFTVNNSTPDLVTAATIAKKQGCRVVTCCCVHDTPLDALSDVILYGYSQSIIPNNLFGMTSRIPLQIISRTIVEYLSL